MSVKSLLAFSILLVTIVPASAAPSATPNTLSDAEQKKGWKLLFDGKSTAGWRGFRKQTMPDGWKVRDGALVVDSGGYIITTDQFDDFELELEWKINEAGNSGIFFNVSEEVDAPGSSGPEYQIVDNARSDDGKKPITSAGSNYAVNPPVRDVTKPVGQWNHARLVVKGNRVEHWMNGVKLLEYELDSPDWKRRVAESKFNDSPTYGKYKKGHISLQDHGDIVWFRNIKIRERR